MCRRRPPLLLALTSALVLLAAGCGGDDGGGSVDGYERVYRYPTGPDDTVVRLDLLGGVQPEGADFLALPAVLVAGDGSVYTQAPVVTPYPGPLVPQMSVRTLTPAGMDALLGVADANELLAASGPVPDAPAPTEVETVRVEIHAQGEVFVHQATLDEADRPERAGLFEFVDALGQLESVAGPAQLGVARAFVPDEYRLRAEPVDPDQLVRNGVRPTTVPWPADAGVGLAAASDCVTVDADVLRSTFEAADQLTLFLDGAQAYQVIVAPRLPVDPDC